MEIKIDELKQIADELGRGQKERNLMMAAVTMAESLIEKTERKK
jgi:hypothetical protein